MTDSPVINLPRGEPTPQETVAELDRYIVGQAKAKRAVAVALRNRYRRRQITGPLRDDVRPKNILMIGPTGVGKTEIARRLAQIAGVPFLKVEATKFTEVGYVGRDVDSMIRDLVEVAIRLLRTRKLEALTPKARQRARERLLDVLLPPSRPRHPLSGFEKDSTATPGLPMDRIETDSESHARSRIAARLDAGDLDDKMVEIDVTETVTPMVEVFTQSGIEEMGFNLQGFQSALGNLFPPRHKRRQVKVAEAREIFFHEEINRLLDQEELQREAVRLAEDSGIVFLDEIDKIAASYVSKTGPDVSREGVQRDLLPLVEGTTVVTKYGMVKTDHILFIAAGAFNVSKPSDLIPELQGRFPVRVELDKLTVDDFKRILTEPQNALVKQYAALLEVDGVALRFHPDAIDRIARFACEANANQENIGARRLHTIMELLLDEISFQAPAERQGEVEITPELVERILAPVLQNQDLARFIL
ncbi:MAG: ATP-dependent hsl protease ATP-binding subunit HslU [Candidatus Ozemobacter sibiricus]|jgi:ATP-dependent HslUV protease ATP-binding subunit HslU|uniref:ATP-dependent protease ATPase subunit HslU n=1 Tax=Candidatus Ozemobacter sibiricus TaxID=2268124 RepID=A0A367ZPR3_9BACT|nr:MAG: ATP-dependent hsl protease ATP-binding subunit HslU [Candidatus Ozemobacter sibiricus]